MSEDVLKEEDFKIVFLINGKTFTVIKQDRFIPEDFLDFLQSFAYSKSTDGTEYTFHEKEHLLVKEK